MFDADSRSQPTRRFAGVEFVPSSILVRSFGEKGSHESGVNENEARYNDFVPLVYGTAWYYPPTVFARNDGNLTHMEVLLGVGEMQSVLKLIVNNIEIPQGQVGRNMTATGWFNVVSLGTRTGAFNLDFTSSTGRPLGDPYGSLAVLSVVVPNRILSGSSMPTVQALVEGIKLPTFDTDGQPSGIRFSNNPAWVLLDVLRRAGWPLDEVDLSSFAQVAGWCDELVPVRDLNDNAVPTPRAQCNLVIRKRKSVAELVRGIRTGAGLLLTYGLGGKLQLRVEGNLATQQPERPVGSNAREILGGGWPAYEFGDGSGGFSDILRRDNGQASLRFWSKSNAETPNRYSLEFQDAFNAYQQDSLSIVDAEDATRTGQEVSVAFPALGIPNFSQARRLMRRSLRRSLYGNLFVDFETSCRGLGLTPGDLITLTYQREGFDRQPFRITRIAPGLNFATLQITAQLHKDEWYEDDAESGGGTGLWRPSPGLLDVPAPLVGSLLDEGGEPQLGVDESAAEDADGGQTLSLSVSFITPERPDATSARPPLLSLSPRVDATGGQLKGETAYYYALSSLDQDRHESQLSFHVRATTPAGPNTASVTLVGLSFAPATTAFRVYRGTSPGQFRRLTTIEGSVERFLDRGDDTLLSPPPDAHYDHANMYWRFELAPEQTVRGADSNTITSGTLTMDADEYRGAIVRITKGTGAGQERAILGNTAESIVLSSPWDQIPDPSSRFVIAESSWRFGATTKASPATFSVPNRAGATIQLLARSANVLDRECASDLSPLTRWQLTGAGQLGSDQDVPPSPTFGLQATGRGALEVSGLGFHTLENTRTIQAGTLTVHYWNEWDNPSALTLAQPLTAEGTRLQVTGGPAEVADLLQCGTELIRLDEKVDDSGTFEVSRAQKGTEAVEHAIGERIYRLANIVSVMSLPRGYFGSPASGNYIHTVVLPHARVAAADLFVTNDRGNSETSSVNFVRTTDAGLRTLNGGQLMLQVEGALAIQEDVAPPMLVEQQYSVRDIFAAVREAPTQEPVQLRLNQNGEEYCQITIPAGETISPSLSGIDLPPLLPAARLTLDILSVSQSADSLPGRDLTVVIRL